MILCALLLLSPGCEETSGPERPSTTVPATNAVLASNPAPPPQPTLSPETSYTPDPNPPSTVFLYVDRGAFTVTNAEGRTLTHGEGFFGTMDILEQWENQEELSSDPHLGFVLRVPYSDHLIYERAEAPDEDGLWHISANGFRDNNSFQEFFSAKGGGPYGGGVERVEYDASGSLLVRGEPGDGPVELTLILPGSVLDRSGWHNGWVRLTAMIGGEGEIRLEGRENVIRFSGLEPGGALLECGPDSGLLLSLNLERGSGTLDFSGAAQREIVLQEEGLAPQTLPTPAVDPS